MADYDLKSITADTDGPSADTELLFGSPDQSAGTPKPYSFAGIKTWIKAWIVKGDVGLGNVTNVDCTLMNPFFADSTVYLTSPAALGTSTGALTADRLYMVPVYLKGGVNYTKLAVVVTGAGAGSTVAQMALYTASNTTGRPTGAAPVATGAATIATDSTGVKTATINYTPTNSGWFYIAYLGNGAPTTSMFSTAGFAGPSLGMQFTATPAAVVTYGLFRALTYGASPFVDESATTFSLPSGTNVPILGIR